MQLAYGDHYSHALRLFRDLGNHLSSGSKIENLHFISSFPNTQFLDLVLQQKGLENIRHWRTKLAQSELFKEMQRTGSSLLADTFFEHWNGLHRHLHTNLLFGLLLKDNGSLWLSSNELDGYVWGFLDGAFSLERASTFPAGRTLWKSTDRA